MDGNTPTLTFEEISTAKAAIRVIRYLWMIAVAVALPLVILVATPLIGWALLAAIVLSPLLFGYLLLSAAHQARLERHQAGS